MFLRTISGIVFGVLSVILQLSCQLSLLVIIKKKTDVSSEIWYTCIYLILIVPDLLNLIKSVWRTSILSKKGYKQWPTWPSILTGLVFSVLDSILLAYLATSILPCIPEYLIPALLFIIAASNVFIHNINQKQDVKRSPERLCRGILLLFVVLCLVSVGVLLQQYDHMTVLTSSFLCLCLLEHTIFRFVPLQRYILGQTFPTVCNCSIVYSFVRLISFSLSLYFLANHGTHSDIILQTKDVSHGIVRLFRTDLVYFLIVHIVSAFLMQISNYISTQTKRAALTVVLPAILSNTVSIVICTLFRSNNFYGLQFISEEIRAAGLQLDTPCIILYSLCGSIYIVITISLFWHISKIKYKSSKSKEVPSVFTSQYSSLFLGQELITNQLFPNIVGDTGTSIKRGVRIFVCTTMYQEAKHEMDRLLRSISTLSKSKLLKKRNVYIESHIFLDNGANGKDVKDFGIQLLSLVERNFETCKDYGLMLYTPYGIQLSWERPNQMPLFMHLKDVSKVKAKKRWSQVMYMKYVLEFRSKYISQQQSFTPNNYLGSTESLDVNVLRDTDAQSSQPSGNLTVPIVQFGPGSSVSCYSSPDTLRKDLGKKYLSTLKDNLTKNEYTDFEQNPVFNEGDEVKPDGLYTEYSFKFDTKSQMSSGTLDDSRIFTVSGSESNESNLPPSDYILATDADMSFDVDSVLNLIDVSEKNSSIGGVCGRTFPIGLHRHPIVLLQMFDYAKDFWMIKSAQNVIGSVMCCPGCFSLYRCSAVEDVLSTYSEPTQTMEDIFTKDNGEDRWMCTLMMLKGWKLRYSCHGKNTTYCPEDTDEFMKQRRRWLLSDFANAIVLAKNIPALMKRNTCFTLVYTLYAIQLFIVMVLYPGSTIMMLALGFELVTGVPLLADAAVLVVVFLAYSLVLISHCTPTIKLIISKVLILVLGLLNLYISIATGVIIFQGLKEDIDQGIANHFENYVLLGVASTYIYSALLHPSELWVLVTGVVYLFYLPLLNILLPFYAVCNIVDQSWGTRDDQKASVPTILTIPKFGKGRRKSIKVDCSSYTSLSSSALDISETEKTESEFWKQLVQNLVGKEVNPGITQEERNTELKRLRFKALSGYLLINFVWVILLCGLHAFLINLFDNKLVYVIVLVVILGLSPLIQLTGMTVYKISDLCKRLGEFIS